MDAQTAPVDTRLTYDDLLLFPEDGKRHELIDGEHIVTPTPVTRHQRLVTRLTIGIGAHLDAHPEQGEVFAVSVDIVLTLFDVVVPDLIVIAGDQADIVGDKCIRGAPAIVVEVLSPRTRKRDAQAKRRLYERSGVREYWLVDPELDLVQVFRSAEGRFGRADVRTAEDRHTLTTPVLPGCAIDLPTLFR